jgi:hypothetical protein
MWDQIALKIYGSERYTNVLMRANPTLASVITFDAGIPLIVPVVNVSSNISVTPWTQILSAG